jgi:4-hydroxybenzoate polyprenyltransferase
MQTTTKVLSPSRPSWRDYLELVKFPHAIFALPFALGAMLIAARGLPDWNIVGWILLAMVGARTAAMGFNRIVDRHIDAQNPRTANREIPAGKIKVWQAAWLVIISSALFLFSAWSLNFLAFWLSFPTLALLLGYSYCKRFTSLAHFVLGLCLGIAPMGAWIAVKGKFELAPIALTLAVMFWVAGFDVIYATMDDAFDRDNGIHSLVQKWGIGGALLGAKIFHAIFILLMLAFGFLAGLKVLFPIGVLGIGAFLIYEHALVKVEDIKRINAAFFTVNGIISLIFLGLVILALL